MNEQEYTEGTTEQRLTQERAARIEAERRATEQLATLTQLTEGVVIADPSGRITLVNDAALRLDGIDWQTGYGVFSFGEKSLPNVVRYVHDQDRRHATGALWPELERVVARGINDGPNRPPKANTPP